MTVVTRVLFSLARLYPRLLGLMYGRPSLLSSSLLCSAKAAYASPSLISLWNTLKSITSQCFLFMSSNTAVLRVVAASIKFIEAAIITQTEPLEVIYSSILPHASHVDVQDDPKLLFRPSELDRNDVIGFVQAANIQAQARKMLKMLIETMKAPDYASSRALVIISSVANIGAKRHELAPFIVESLVRSSLPFFAFLRSVILIS